MRYRRSRKWEDEEMIDFLGDVRQDIPEELWSSIRMFRGFTPLQDMSPYRDVMSEYI